MTEPDRRETPRHAVRIVAEVRPTEGDGGALGIVDDLSRTGACFLTNRRFQAGDQLRIEIRTDTADGGPTLDVVCEVVRTVSMSPRQGDLLPYRVAVKFTNDLRDHEDLIERLSERLRAQTSG